MSSGDPNVDSYKSIFDSVNADYGPNVAVVIQEGSSYVIYGYEDDSESENWTNFWDVRNLLRIRYETANIGNGRRQKASFDMSTWSEKCQLLHENNWFTVEYEEVAIDEAGKRTFQQKRILTPGTQPHRLDARANFLTAIFIDRLYPEEEVIKVEKMMLRVGLAAIDISTGESYVSESTSLSDERKRPIYDAYQFLLSHPTKEVVIVCDMPLLDEKHRYELEKYLHHSLSLDKYALRKVSFEYDRNRKDTSYQNYILHSSFFAEENSGSQGTILRLGLILYPSALNALVVALNAVNECNPHTIGSLPRPHVWDSDSHLTLTYNSAEQLHLCSNTKKRTDSVLNLIDRTQTPMGRRQLETWLLNPIVGAKEINARLDAVQSFVEAGNEARIEYRAYLRGVSNDIVRIVRKAGSLTPKKLATLYRSLMNVDPVFQWPITCLPNGETIFSKWLPDKETRVAIFSLLCFIEKTFDVDKMEKAKIDSTNVSQMCFFKPGYNNVIDRAVKRLKEVHKRTNQLAKALTKTLGCEVTWVNSTRGNFCFKVPIANMEMVKWYIQECKKNPEAPIRRWKNHKHFNEEKNKPTNHAFRAAMEKGRNPKAPPLGMLDASEKELFLDLKLVRERDKTFTIDFEQCSSWWITIDNASDTIRQNIGAAFRRFIEEHVIPSRNAIMDVSQKVAAMDCLYSYAATASQYRYHRPEIDGSSDHSYVTSDGVRHPIVEIINETETYVANPVDLNQSGIINFGPNNSGKSTYNKSIGINIVLAQAGCFVAAKNFRIAPYRRLMTRLSNYDDMHTGQGTFKVQISELGGALRRADQYSMVLGDEPCNGTEVGSAVPLVGTSIIELAESGASFVFATHYNDLATDPDFEQVQQLPNVVFQHFEVKIDRADNTILYYRHAKPGVGETEYGLEVAATSDFPQKALKRAFNMRKKRKGEPVDIASNKRSRYNSKVIVDRCQWPGCNKRGVRGRLETHHLKEQQCADEDGFIDDAFHKNTVPNLEVLCEEHHGEITRRRKLMTRKVASGTGNPVTEIVDVDENVTELPKLKRRKRVRRQTELQRFFGPKTTSTEE